VKSNAFTWVGFVIVALGWALLVADLTVSDTILKAGNLVAVLSLRSDIATVAQAAIISGFGFAIVGTLRSGFGAFSRFFEAVLQRSGSGPRPTPSAPQPMSVEPREPAPPAATPVEPSPLGRPRPPPMPPSPYKERNYVILADGSVEVETMFGTRVFATMDEARDFIR
jgi:hypothetical protein